MQKAALKHQKILYIGLDPSRCALEGNIVHVPLIEIVPHPFESEIRERFESLHSFTHVILTSRIAAQLYLEYSQRAHQNVREKIYIVVGPATAQVLEEAGITNILTAKEHTGEGVVQLLEQLALQDAHLFLPRSSVARDVIPTYCAKWNVRLTLLELYVTIPSQQVLPDLTDFDCIVFTSPSAVHAFFAQIKTLPPHVQCYPIGPVTEQTLKALLLPAMLNHRHDSDNSTSCCHDAKCSKEGS